MLSVPDHGPLPIALSALSYLVQQLKGRVPLFDSLLEVLQADGGAVILPLHRCADDLDIMLCIVDCLQDIMCVRQTAYAC